MDKSAVQRLIDTVESTGGVYRYASGNICGPVADPEWLDVADAYIAACAEVGKEPLFVACTGDEDICTCDGQSWHGEEHCTDCPLEGPR